MNVEQMREVIKTELYKFLKEDEHLGDSIVMLAVGGSHGYGMNTETSDLDIRGIALNSKKEILTYKDFEQVVDVDTDTTIYSVNKMITLLRSNNPNTIEILGCRPEHYLKLTNIGKQFIEHRHMFISQICINTFGMYAQSQLRRLQNRSMRALGQSEQEQFILNSINGAQYSFPERYMQYDKDSIKLYIDKSERQGFDSEIYMDLNMSHYPLRDWCDMWNEMKSIVSSYNKLGKRNEKALNHDKISKHMAHLLRLYMMAIDILEKEEIITYRENEHDLLMNIRNGEYITEDNQVTADFYDILDEYKKRFEYAVKNTSLRQLPDDKEIEEFRISLNEAVVNGNT